MKKPKVKRLKPCCEYWGAEKYLAKKCKEYLRENIYTEIKIKYCPESGDKIWPLLGCGTIK